MNVQIQSVKFDADKKLIEFVENKMSKLERFADRATGAEVILKLDKDFEKGNKVATITLHMPGEDMVAEHRARAFEEAIDEAIDALKRQIEKFTVGDVAADIHHEAAVHFPQLEVAAVVGVGIRLGVGADHAQAGKLKLVPDLGRGFRFHKGDGGILRH